MCVIIYMTDQNCIPVLVFYQTSVVLHYHSRCSVVYILYLNLASLAFREWNKCVTRHYYCHFFVILLPQITFNFKKKLAVV